MTTWSDHKTSPPAEPGRATGALPEGTSQPAGSGGGSPGPAGLQGAEWRDAVKRATSALHAAQRRQAGRYTPAAKRSAGARYRPGMARREP